MSSLHFAPLATAVFVALSSHSALAADAADATELERVVAVGSRTPQSISAIPGTVWVIDQAQLEEQFRAGVPLKEALSQLIPGLDIGPQGRTNAGQNLRGRSVLVMIDGVSLNSSRAISRQFDSIDPFNIERIEVLSGASAIYGGGATGGIINIITKRGGEGLAFETEVGVRSGFESGSDHDLRVAQSISGGNGPLAGRLAVAYQDNGAAYDANGKQVLMDITQTDLQYNRSLDVMGNLDFDFGDGKTLRLTGQVYDSGYDGDRGLYLGPNLSGAIPATTARPELIEVRDGFDSDVEPQSRRRQVNADFHAQDVFGGQHFYLQAFARSEKLDFHPFPGTFSYRRVDTTRGSLPYYSASKQNTDLSGFKAVLEKQWGNFGLTYGFDVDHETFDSSQALFDIRQAFASGGLVMRQVAEVGRYPKYTVDGISGFIQAQWQVSDALRLNAGWRHQQTKIEVGDFVATGQQTAMANNIGTSADAIAGGRNDYDVDLFNVGAVWAFDKQHQLWANYTEGFQVPDPGKYYGQGTYVLDGAHWRLLNGVGVSNEPLDGIKTKQVEIGWRQYGESFDLQAAAFYAWSDRDIVLVPVTLAIDQIERKVRNFGVEAQLTWRFHGGWQVGGNLLAIRTENENDAGDWERAAVTDASPSKLGAFAGWEGDRIGVRLQALRSLDLKDGDDRELDGYTTVDLVGHWQLPKGTLNFGVQNLLDEDYTTIWGQRAQVYYGALAAKETFDFRGRGRTFGLSYSIRY